MIRAASRWTLRRAFMPAAAAATKDAVELEKLVGTEITCRITKLDVTTKTSVSIAACS